MSLPTRRDPLDILMGRYDSGMDTRPVDGRLGSGLIIVQSSSQAAGGAWRCLGCLGGGNGSLLAVELAVEVHRATGGCDTTVAFARSQLLDAICDRSESEFAAGWMVGIEGALLARGGIWAMLAEQLGWPVGWLGLEGWDTNLDAALARYQLSRAEVPVP